MKREDEHDLEQSYVVLGGQLPIFRKSPIEWYHHELPPSIYGKSVKSDSFPKFDSIPKP